MNKITTILFLSLFLISLTSANQMPSPTLQTDYTFKPTILSFESDNNNDGTPDVFTTFTEVEPNVLEIFVNQTNSDKKYKWQSGLFNIEGIDSVKVMYEDAQGGFKNAYPVNLGLYNYQWTTGWNVDGNTNGYALFGNGAGNKRFRLILPEGDKKFKIFTGSGTEEILFEWVNNTYYIYSTDEYSKLDFNVKVFINGSQVKTPDVVFIEPDTNTNNKIEFYPNISGITYPLDSVTFQVNQLTIPISKIETAFSTEESNWELSFDTFESKNNITSKTIEPVYHSVLECLSFANIIFWNQFVECRDTSYAYNINYFGNIVDLDPTISITNTTSTHTIQEQVVSEPEFSHLEINDSSLVGYWSFDKNARDLTNNNNDGTLTGNAFVNESSGKYGGTLQLDGSGDYVDLGGDIDNELSNGFTISSWINTDDVSNNKVFVSNLDTGVGNGLEFRIYPSNDVRVVLFDTGLTNYIGRDTTDNEIDTNTWYHVVASWNGTFTSESFNIYIDGIKTDDSNIESGTVNSFELSSDNMAIGTRIDTNSHAFEGQIDEVMIFNHALNSTEIQEIYNSTYSRFYSEGNQTFKFKNVTLGTDNRVNITAEAEALNGSSLSASLWEANVGENTGYVDNNSGVDLNGLVGYWHGDGNALDYSGNGNDGTFNADANANAVGVFNNSFSFDGTGDYVNASSVMDLSFNGQDLPISVSAWIKINKHATSLQSIVTKYDGTTNNRGFWFEINSVGSINIVFSNPDNFNNRIGVASTTLIDLDEWTYVTFSYNGSKTESGIKVYINGVQSETSTYSSGTYTGFNSSADLLIGAVNTGTTYNFNGSIDEVMIFNRSLSAEEIKSLYITGSTDHRNDGVGVNWTESSSGSQELEETNVSILDYETECSDGLVSMWVADSTYGFNDTCGRNNGTAYGDTSIIERDDYALLNGTYSFDGTGDYVRITDSSSLGFNSASSVFSISAWIKANNASGRKSIVSKYTSNTKKEWFFEVNDGTLRTFAYENPTGGADYTALKSDTDSAVINTGEWYFVTNVVDINGDTISFYVDGKEVASTPITGSVALTDIGNTDARITIGIDEDGTGFPFNGSIDEVSIWNRSLSQEEILELYYAGTERHRATHTVNNESNYLLPEFNFDDYLDNGFYSPILETFLMESWEQTGPVIDTTAPTWSNNETNLSTATLPNTAIYFNITLTDETAGGQYIFSWYNGSIWQNDSAVNWTTPQEIEVIKENKLTEGIINWTWYFNDSSGNTNQSDVWSVHIQPIPVISDIYPTNGNTYTSLLTTSNFTVNFADGGEYCWYSLNGGTTNSTPIDASAGDGSYEFTGVPFVENSNTIDIWCNSSNSDVGTGSSTFTIDLPPTLEINKPTTANQDLIFPFQMTCTDTQGVEDQIYTWDNTNYSYSSQVNLNGVVGAYTILAYCNDTYGSMVSDSVTFNIVGAGSNETEVGTTLQTCRYKRYGYYNTELPWFRQEDCI